MGLYNKHYDDFISFLKDKQSKYVLNMIEIVSDYFSDYIVNIDGITDDLYDCKVSDIPKLKLIIKQEIIHKILEEIDNDKR